MSYWSTWLRNPVLLLTVALPVASVVAGVSTVLIALGNADSTLPDQYHSEGLQADRDFTRAARAAELGVQATIAHLDAPGECTVALELAAAAPATLDLLLTHGTLPQQDQRIVFALRDARPGEPALYDGHCRGAQAGHWSLELADAADTWSIRQGVQGSLAAVTLSAGVLR